MVVSSGLIWSGFVIAAMVFGGIFYRVIGEAIAFRKYPPLGQLIDVGGFSMHIHSIGQGVPTVIMDAGGGAPSISWGLVPSQIAKFTRVCTYDRAKLLQKIADI